MALNKQSQDFLDRAKSKKLPPMYLLNVEQARERMETPLTTNRPVIDSGEAEDRYIPCPWGQLPIRIYYPQGHQRETDGRPVVIFYHGGGWVLDNVETHDTAVRHLVIASDCVFVSVDYRLAPEWKFPCGVEDCWTALTWVWDNAVSLGADPESLAVCGDSAGGNLATVMCLLARDRGSVPIRQQVLFYPNTDYILNGWESAVSQGTGFSLTTNLLVWFFNHYVHSDEDRRNPYLCPYQAETLRGLPPAYIITARHDPLHDEGEAYAQKLARDGVSVTYECCEDMMHGFIVYWDQIDEALNVLRRAGQYLKKALFV